MLQTLPRRAVVALLALSVFFPLGLVLWQSVLSGPFFMPSAQLSLESFVFIFEDPDFWMATRNTLIVAVGMSVIAIPLGAVLAFIMVRTDLPGRRWLETPILIPIFVSPVVLGFGYVVSLGPVGFFSVWFEELFGYVPWNIYSLAAIVVIAGLTHVPHVYLYSSSALRNLGSDVEEAARLSGASPFRVARDVSIPMVSPALLYVGVLVFFLGFEIFGLPLILGDPEGHLVLTTYLYKLTNKLGTPSYHLMAAVATCIIAVTFPLVLLQRALLKSAQRFVAMKGKSARQRPLALGPWKWLALAVIALWLLLTIVVPVSGVALRSVVSSWGTGINLLEVLTLDHFRAVFEEDVMIRSILNSILIGTFGGALAVGGYLLVGLATHRKPDGLSRLVDYIVLTPRAVPGLMAGLAVFWVFLFVPFLAPLRSTLFSVWFAYAVVWLAYGMRLIQSALMQVGPELEEAGRLVGASRARVSLDITVPLIRNGLLGAWLLVFMIFEREYSTGVYLLSPGTEVIGAQIVSLWASGAVDVVAALSLINMLLVGSGLALALRFGVKLHD
ncbi:ABC transporter permease [Zoogloea dura]|uniref:Iron ABC transporter permease n=1 Tax=Zoogloea dura TaxID=2728840 RepID=A0A848G966_9RHOO|nr:iron ABC transporter permease [Zoogloea dura]NML27702.1 iron ABC transporter permease [Zoogloea dura]